MARVSADHCGTGPAKRFLPRAVEAAAAQVATLVVTLLSSTSQRVQSTSASLSSDAIRTGKYVHGHRTLRGSTAGSEGLASRMQAGSSHTRSLFLSLAGTSLHRVFIVVLHCILAHSKHNERVPVALMCILRYAQRIDCVGRGYHGVGTACYAIEPCLNNVRMQSSDSSSLQGKRDLRRCD